MYVGQIRKSSYIHKTRFVAVRTGGPVKMVVVQITNGGSGVRGKSAKITQENSAIQHLCASSRWRTVGVEKHATGFLVGIPKIDIVILLAVPIDVILSKEVFRSTFFLFRDPYR